MRGPVRVTSLLLCVAEVMRGARALAAASSAPFSLDLGGSRALPELPLSMRHKAYVVVHRHGDRCPIHSRLGSVINDSPEDRSFWSSKLPSPSTLAAMAAAAPLADGSPGVSIDHGAEPYAQLTQRGVEELRRLGAQLRERLVGEGKLLGGEVGPEALSLRSTNFNRSQQSLRSLILGLYPTAASNPPSIVVLDKADETMLPSGKCDRRQELLRSLDETILAFPGLPRLEEGLRKAIGAGEGEGLKWQHAREMLVCYAAHDRALPGSVTPQLLTDVNTYAAWVWGQWFSRPELNRLSIGRLLKDVLDGIDAAMTGPTVFYAFSGHDSTIVPLLCALGAFDVDTPHWPPYASFVAFEVAEGTPTPGAAADVYVRVVYNGDVVGGEEGGGGWRRLEELRRQLQPLIPVDYHHECRALADTSEADAQGELAAALQ